MIWVTFILISYYLSNKKLSLYLYRGQISDNCVKTIKKYVKFTKENSYLSKDTTTAEELKDFSGLISILPMRYLFSNRLTFYLHTLLILPLLLLLLLLLPTLTTTTIATSLIHRYDILYYNII